MVGFLGFLIFVCFLAIPFSVLWLIINLIRKRDKKKPVFLLIGSFVGLVAFSLILPNFYTEEDLARIEQNRIEREEQERKEQEEKAAEKEKEDELKRIEELSEEQGQKIAELENQTKDYEKKTEEYEKRIAELENQTEDYKKQIDDIEKEKDKTVVKTSASIVEKEKAVEVFAPFLAYDVEQYIGKKVSFSIQCSVYNEKDKSIRSNTLNEPYKYFNIYLDESHAVETSDYVKVTGTVEESDSYSIDISGAYVEDVGEIPKAEYLEGKELYKQDFIENAETPTYEDLMRYPDAYKSKRIKLELKIIRTEPDGLIFQGDIEAELSGQSLAITDEREVQEPKFLEGDYVTVYGYGDGLVTVKVKQGFKTVDEYSIPGISAKYVIFD